MARIRYLKPDFFKDEDIAELPIQTRLFFAGLWCFADREGRLEERIKRLKVEIFPYDEANIEKMLQQLAIPKKGSNKPFIIRYKMDNEAYIQIVNFKNHQKPHHSEANSVIPSPNGFMIINEPYPNKKIRKEVYQRDNYKCVYCNLDLNKQPRKICLDHVIPIVKGGSNSKKNLVTSCKKCNAKKLALTPLEAGLKQPNGFGEYIGQQMVNTPLTISDKGMGNGEGNGDGEGSRASPALQAALDKVHKEGLNIYALLNKLKKDSKIGAKLPEEVLLAVCECYSRNKVKVKDPWPWFTRTVVAKWNEYNALQNIKQNEGFKKEGLAQSIKDILMMK